MAAGGFPRGAVEALSSADHSLDMIVEVTVGLTPADEDRTPRAATFATTALPDGTNELTAEVDVELSPDAIGESRMARLLGELWLSLSLGLLTQEGLLLCGRTGGSEGWCCSWSHSWSHLHTFLSS